MGQAVTKQNTYTGNVVTFTNNGGAEIDSLSVPIQPTQNLNGYTKPWAGTGKNKIGYMNTRNSYGIYFTYNADGSTTIDGTCSGGTSFQQLQLATNYTNYNLYPAGSYKVTGATGVSTYYLSVVVVSENGTVGDEYYPITENQTITLTSPSYLCPRYVVTNGTHLDNVKMWPMIRDASIADDTWEPYSNICPISGSTGLSVYVSPTSDIADATTYAEDWTSAAGAVYGGTVDIKSGTLTVDRVLVSKTWADGSNAAVYGDCTRKRFSYSDADDKTRKTDAICNVGSYIPNDTSAEWAKGSVFSIHNSNNLFYLSLPTATDGTQAIQLCMYLATPVTYTLTAQTIAALSGANNIWASNNATIEVVVTDILAGFNGWLIKCVTNGTPVEIPLKYIRAETYTVTPDQRMEWSAERDVTGVLHRETVPNTPPKIEFNTPLMTNSDIEALNTIIRNAFTNVLGRDITIQYYNPEQNAYWEWDCYMPDVHYPIRNVDVANNVINYEELRYAFIGY